MAALGSSLIRQWRWTEAEPLLRECLATREKVEPEKWSTFETRSLLGGNLMGQERYAEAVPFLLSGYEGMKQREARIPPEGRARLTAAIRRLVELCEATGKRDESARWRKELEASRAVGKPPEK